MQLNKLLFFLFISKICISTFTLAQEVILSGCVYDTDNSVISNAKITVSNDSIDYSVSTNSNQDGKYSIKIKLHPTNVERENIQNDESFKLFQNYPNPFNPSTILSYQLKTPGNIRLDVFNILGEHLITLVDEYKKTGLYTTQWNGMDKNSKGVSAGVYLYRVTINNYSETKKMILLDGNTNIYSKLGTTYKQNDITSQSTSYFPQEIICSNYTFTIRVEHDLYHKYIYDNLVLTSKQSNYYKELELLHKDSLDTVGYEQTIRVGNIAVLRDLTGGYINGKRILSFKYLPDLDYNPHDEVYYASIGSYIPEFPIGFNTKGRYRFRTYAKLEGMEKDTLLKTYIINVVERRDPLILDPNLEIIIRFSLNNYIGKLTEKSLVSLKKIPIKYCESVTDLSGLKYCSNLTNITLILQKISDLSELEYLPQLDTLAIGQQRVECSDITPLKNLTNLTYLDIELNGVKDLSPLKNLTKLKILDLLYDPISDISPLENMVEMEQLSISRTEVSDISALKNMVNMKELFFGASNIEDITPLRNMSKMHYLYLKKNKISDISSLLNCKELIRLHLGDNNIADISVLEFLPKLRNVSLWKNKISDIGPIVRNLNLKKGCLIDLSNNPLNDKSINEYIPKLRARGIYVTY